MRAVCPGCSQRTGIAAGVEFIARPARNYCPIENIKLKLTTKSQIETRLPEQKYSDANSRSFNVQPHLQQYQCVCCTTKIPTVCE